jgi:predicted P-loop ATPase
MSEILEAALKYARMGWPVLPCDGKNPNVLGSDWQRKATSDEATITRWFTQLTRANNVGVLTGEKFFVLDIDRKHGGYEALDGLLRDYGQLPETLQQISGGGGRHYFFQIPAGETIRSCKIRPGVEIKGYHGFLVVEPSVHPDTGERYVFDDLENTPILAAPEWLLKIVRAGGENRAARPGATRELDVLPAVIPKGTQHDHLVSLAGSLRARGAEADEIFAALWACNQKRCEEPGPEENIRRIAESFMKYPPKQVQKVVTQLKRENESERVRSVIEAGKPFADPMYRAPGGKLELSPTTGRPERTLYNAIAALEYAPHWHGKLAYNEFTMRVIAGADLCAGRIPAGRIIGDLEIIEIMNFMQGMDGLHVSKEITRDAVRRVAGDNSSHPVRNYLNGLTWDGVERCESWLTRYLGVEENLYSRAVGCKWLVSAVARIFRPGEKVDVCLILESPQQGKLKSTALRALVGDEWFSDSLGDIYNKDTLLSFRGKWIIEVQEIDRIFARESSEVKEFVSKKTDLYRPPYAHEVIEVPREFVFSGTTNRSDYLKDETGARRFWPVVVTSVDLDALDRDKHQLWAEAVWLFREGYHWWISSEERELLEFTEREQRARYEGDPWEHSVLEYCEKLGAKPVLAEEILIQQIGKKIADITKQDRNRVAKILYSSGYVRRTFRRGGRVLHGFVFVNQSLLREVA